MRAEVIALEWHQVLLSATLIAVAAVASLVYRLKIEKTIAVAALRTTLQLVAVGYVLRQVFALDRWYAVLPILLLMCALAAHAAVDRTERGYRGMYLTAFGAVLLSGGSVLVFALAAVVRVEPVWDPQYAIPILGMLLGNSLNGIALGLDRFVVGLTERQAEIELLLSHGATPHEAAERLRRDAVRVGMMPILNTMMVVGTVSLPGMMTGQILSGTPPHQAVAYQIVIMFLIAAATTAGTVLVVRWSEARLFGDRARLLLEDITSP